MTRISARRILPAALLCATLLMSINAAAQLKAIEVYTHYANPFAKRLAVEHINGVGGGVDITYALAERVSIGIRGGYVLYSIDQTAQLVGWGWSFWNDRYLNKIQADMRADPSLTSVIGSVQKMDLIPVALHLDYAFVPAEKFVITPSVAGGVSFYTRRLYADETWTKTFAAANYSFTYNFRNFAPAKKGTIVHAGIGCMLQYRVFSDVDVSVAAKYTQYVSSVNQAAYAAFPFENEMDVRLGVDFLY